MATDWPVVGLGDVVDLLTGFPFQSSQYTDDCSAPRLLRGDNVAQGVLRWEGAKRWPRSKTLDVQQYWLSERDVILAMDRPWIEAGLKHAAVQMSDLPALLVQRVARLRGTKALDSSFLKFVIGSRAFTDHVLAVQTGTTIPHISGGQILSYRFLLPGLDEQRAIAHILGTLDDKIELSRRMNETLEAMARALFKSWFVDFDPVRAKADGRDICYLPELSSLFPTALDTNDKPVGWPLGTLIDLCELKRGYDLPTANRLPGPYPIVSSSGTSGWHSVPMAKGPGVVTGRYGTIGEVFFIDEAYWPLNTALYVRDFKENSPRFVYYELLRVEFLQYSDKAAVPGINRNHLHQAPVVLPPRPVQQAFEQVLSPVWARQKLNKAESATLTALRDTLLPKLISGELRVKAAEKIVEAVA